MDAVRHMFDITVITAYSCFCPTILSLYEH